MDKYTLNTETFSTDFQHEGSVISPLLLKLLHLRGITEKQEIENFLNPDYASLHDPYLLADMEKAVKRILTAIQNKEKIVIYSDYDADGIPGAVILHDFFKGAGHENFTNYIPDRHLEGFGFHAKAIEQFSQDQVKLVITIDCGIADITQVKMAQDSGIDVIITDHHEPKAELPEAYAVINPKHPDSKYPYTMICGAATAFKLVQGVLASGQKVFPWKDGQEKWLLDMAGLATLSDMVPLLGENRILAYFGLKVLRKSKRPGLKRLFRKVGVLQSSASEDDISFMITPRINAASRMGNPRDAFHLLSTTDEAVALEKTDVLNKINDERKGVVAGMAKEVRAKIKEDAERFEKVIVIGNPKWRPSLLGLVAGSLVEDFCKPVFLWGRDGEEIIKGSCRGDGKINTLAIMERISGEFLQFGGHKAAGGFSVSFEKIHTLPEAILKSYESICAEEALSLRERVKTMIDEKLSISDLTWKTFDLIDKLAPFGMSNPKPIFLIEQAEVGYVKIFGKQKNHLELGLKGTRVKGICFFVSGNKLELLIPDAKVNLVASLEKSSFGGRKELRLRIIDVFL